MSQLSSEEVSAIMFDTLVLSAMLIEKFEILEENEIIVRKAKQSVKIAHTHLVAYTKQIYGSAVDEDEVKHFKEGADAVLIISNKIEQTLRDTHIMSIDQRRSNLHQILISQGVLGDKAVKIVEKIVSHGLLSY